MAKMPQLSPIQAPLLFCSDCSSPMEPKPVSQANGKLTAINYDCPKCGYTFQPSMQHAHGDTFIGEKKKLPQPGQ